MDSTSLSSNVSASRPLPKLDGLMSALGNMARWKILRELSLGEPREIVELAAVAGCSYDASIKHLGVLLEAGLIVRGRGRVFQIDKQYLASPSERILDYGYCLLRLESVGKV